MMFDRRVKINIRRVVFKDAHAEGIEISGPTSTSVTEVFLAIFDIMGAETLEGVVPSHLRQWAGGPHPGPNAADSTDHEETRG